MWISARSESDCIMMKIIFYITIFFSATKVFGQKGGSARDGFELQCFTKIQQVATYGRHHSDWKRYIQNNYRWRKEMDKYYPPNRGQRVYDTIQVRFVVKPDGFVKDVEVILGKIPVFSKEAAKVIASSPQWKAGRHNGRRVSCGFVQQLIVVLEG